MSDNGATQSPARPWHDRQRQATQTQANAYAAGDDNFQAPLDFLVKLRPNGPWVLTAIIPDGTTDTKTFTDLGKARGFIAAYNGHRNLYYAINPCRSDMWSKPAKTDIAVIEFVHADLDPNSAVKEASEQAKQRYQAHLERLNEKPTVLVDSGNGLQGLWKLQQPIALGAPIKDDKGEWTYSDEDKAKIQDAEDRSKALMQRLGAKPEGTQEISRIFRLPGTINIPNRNKLARGRKRCPTKLIDFHATTFALDDFPLPEPKPKAQEQAEHTPRNVQELFGSLSAELRKLVAGASYDGEDTSETSASVITRLQKKNFTDEEIISLIEAYPRGIGRRYAEGKDLEADVIRLRKKYPSERSGKNSVGKAILEKLGKPRAVRWLWEWHLKRGSLETVSGDPGLGKSQILCGLVATVTAGVPWPDGQPAPTERQNVIMLVSEETVDDELTPRLLAAGADTERVRIIKSIRKNENDEYFLVSEHLVELENAIHELGNVGLITIDPITAFLGTSKKIDSHKTQDVRSVLRGLQDILERNDVACSMLTHPPKGGGGRVLDQFIGSQAFSAAPRLAHLVMWEMQPDEDGKSIPTGRRIYSMAKTNHKYPKSIAFHLELKDVGVDEENGKRIEAPYVVWDEEIDVTAAQALAAQTGGTEPADWKKKREACANFVVMELRDGPKSADEIQQRAKAIDFGRKVLDHACDELGIVKSKDGFQGQWMWSLASDGLTRKR
jgi:hypothetical protein